MSRRLHTQRPSWPFACIRIGFQPLCREAYFLLCNVREQRKCQLRGLLRKHHQLAYQLLLEPWFPLVLWFPPVLQFLLVLLVYIFGVSRISTVGCPWKRYNLALQSIHIFLRGVHNPRRTFGTIQIRYIYPYKLRSSQSWSCILFGLQGFVPSFHSLFHLLPRVPAML